MLFAHFCLQRGYRPKSAIKVEFAPFCVAKFARTDKHMGSELQGKLREFLTVVAFNCAEKIAYPFRFYYRAIVCHFRRHQSATQIARRIG